MEKIASKHDLSETKKSERSACFDEVAVDKITRN
jgi:hypothetical protein